MYEIKYGSRFNKAYKRIINSGNFDLKNFERILHLFRQGKDLEYRHHDHALKGNYVGLRECHIRGDCLLVYEIDHIEKNVRLVNIGNHANLFE